MYDRAPRPLTYEAVVESFVGKTVRVITTITKIHMEFVGTLVDLNGKGYYQVHIGNFDVASDNDNGAVVNFNKGTVQAAWVAASGNIIRLEA